MMLPVTHFVQFYGGANERKLVNDVGAYLAEGLLRGNRCVVAATKAHRDAFCAFLEKRGLDTETHQEAGTLLLLDAVEMSKTLLEDGVPSKRLFDEHIGRTITRTAGGERPVLRIYGEIVGVYTSQGRHDCAAALEDIWNEFLRDENATLYCGYPIDVFKSEFATPLIDKIMCGHSHGITAVDDKAALSALDAALADVLGAHAGTVRELMGVERHSRWAATPQFEGYALWLRTNLRRHAENILARTAQILSTT